MRSFHVHFLDLMRSFPGVILDFQLQLGPF